MRLLNTELKNVEKKIDSLLELMERQSNQSSQRLRKSIEIYVRGKSNSKAKFHVLKLKIDHFKITETGKDYISESDAIPVFIVGHIES